MQLRRAALPLSLLALLASAGCVSVRPEATLPDPARGSVPPLGAPDAPDPDAGGSAHRRLAEGAHWPALPLGALPADAAQAEPPAAEPPAGARPRGERPVKPAPPRRVRPPGSATARDLRQAGPRLPRGEELCAAAEGTVPPSIVDLCVRQYGR
ncbi:hypothetical protein AB0P15_00685 [Streptomyces sp. NPDC087917]|uniref:hypothetical protein n=1 Tax=unclassified Streptomyces TaxID=2593676 RepID=UPI003419E98C